MTITDFCIIIFPWSNRGLIIISIVIISGLLGFWQEKGATDAITKLLEIVQLKTTVLGDRKLQGI